MNEELIRKTELLETKMSDVKENLQTSSEAKMEEQDIRMEEFRRATDTSTRTLDTDLKASLATQKEETDLAVNELRRAITLQKEEMEDRSQREMADMKTDTLSVQQKVDHNYQDLKSKMEYANRELKQGFTAEIKTTREQLEDDLDINKKKLVETDDRLQAMIMEETAAREQNCTDVVSSTGATMSQKDKEQDEALDQAKQDLLNAINALDNKVGSWPPD